MLSPVCVCLLILFFRAGSASAQPTSLWYFGDHAGLDFASGDPAAIVNGAISTQEGSASIADARGNLLFYTDGVTVFNSQHQPMPNGRNLWGHFSTTQTLIIPKPKNDSIYYIITASPQFDALFGANTDSVGLHYSIVTLYSSGFGDVTTRNVLVFKNTTEKITAVHHANMVDIWLVAHEWGSNTFRSYLITKNGIVNNPVTSSLGSIHQDGGLSSGDNSNALGQMKISPDGTKIALALFDLRRIEVFQFDKSTGKILDLVISITAQGITGKCYGLEFSPSGNLLYFTVAPNGCGYNDPENRGILWQYSLSTNVTTKVGEYIGSLNALQLGQNGRIYVSRCNDILGDSGYLGIISFPNREGEACGFINPGVYLGGKRNQLGLPNFIQSYFLFPDPVVDMPNVFSPNGDDYNPVFRPFTFENMMDADLQIINRWGQEVFHTKEVSMGWNGGDSSSGVYYWLLRYEGKNGKTGVEKGWVQLIR